MVTEVAKLVWDLWQESHLETPVVTGMCVVPLLTADVLPLWQVSQVPVPTALAGRCVYCTLNQLLVDLWQLSQTVTPVCVLVLGLGVKPYAAVAWQLAQPVATVTLVWNLAGNQVINPALWHVMQFAVVGIWLGSLPVAVEPLWQVVHVVAAVNVL